MQRPIHWPYQNASDSPGPCHKKNLFMLFSCLVPQKRHMTPSTPPPHTQHVNLCTIYTNTTYLVHFHYLCVHGLRTDHFSLDNCRGGSSLREANSPSSCSQQLPTVLYLGGVTPHHFSPSRVLCLLVQSCLCSHFQQRLFHCNLHGSLILSIFLFSRDVPSALFSRINFPKTNNLHTF